MQETTMMFLPVFFLIFPTFAMCAGSVSGAAKHAVMVFENERYQQQLAAALDGDLDIIDCSGLTACLNPSPSDAARTIAVVVALPHNYSLFPTLKNLKLFQSPFYIPPQNKSIQPESVGISVYYPDYKNRSSPEDAVDPMAEWTVAQVLRWLHRSDAQEKLFRKCAFEANAPLDCPSFSAMTTHKTLWRNPNLTIGVLGFGAVGKAMVDHFAPFGNKIIASDIRGPYSPLPKGLSWFGPDNDHVLREADFVIVAVAGFLTNFINKTALGLMKPDAVLIPMDPTDINYDDLYAALVSKKIGGAILDVEPQGCFGIGVECGPPYGAPAQPFKQSNKFQDLPNVVLSGNVMMQTELFWDNSAKFVGANLKALVQGKPLAGIVRPIGDNRGGDVNN